MDSQSCMLARPSGRSELFGSKPSPRRPQSQNANCAKWHSRPPGMEVPPSLAAEPKKGPLGPLSVSES
eukprot:6531818-Alexandrium_andersonii.AAC.1